jgi:hypothetical protein
MHVGYSLVQRVGEPQLNALLYAGEEEGGPPIMAKGHVFHRGPLNLVSSLQVPQEVMLTA